MRKEKIPWAPYFSVFTSENSLGRPVDFSEQFFYYLHHGIHFSIFFNISALNFSGHSLLMQWPAPCLIINTTTKPYGIHTSKIAKFERSKNLCKLWEFTGFTRSSFVPVIIRIGILEFCSSKVTIMDQTC